MPAVDPNIVIILILLLGGTFGAVAGKQKLRTLILSVYVGIVFSEQLTGTVAPLVSFLTRADLSMVLFAAPIVVFGFAKSGIHSDKGALIANILVGVATGGLVISSALKLMPVSQMATINGASYVAMLLGQYHVWLLGGLPVVALILGLMKPKEHHHGAKHHR